MAHDLEPLFLDGAAGPVFALHVRPHRPNGRAVLCLPPFAEEMNRARRMVSEQARRLADRGIGCLILDVHGTGDSGGDFAAARWPIWRDDAKAALSWLKNDGYHDCAILGLRLGALLALDVALAAPDQPSRLLFWQPVVAGELHLSQFLRIRVAAGLDQGGEKETVGALRARLGQGEILEVAGYPLTPELAGDLDSLAMPPLAEGWQRPVHWFEIGRADGPDVTPASAKAIATFPGDVTASTIAGAPFWTIEEPTFVPALWTATESALQ